MDKGCFYFIKNEYFEEFKDPFLMTNKERVEEIFEKELISKAKKVLTLYRKGIKLIFPNVQIIENKLVKLL